MTFKELQDATLADRFASRDRAKQAINLRLGELLGLEEWAFLRKTATVTITAGSRTIPDVPTDLGVVNGPILLTDGSWLMPRSLTDFWKFHESDTTAGPAYSFTAPGDGTILVGPIPTVTISGMLVYQKDAPLLVADADVPVTPAWSHLGLVAGAQAFLARLDNDATYSPLEESHQRTIDGMRRRYLTSMRGTNEQMGAWTAGY